MMGKTNENSGRRPVGDGLFHSIEETFGQIVHEGKNHLGPIKGYASLVQDGTEDESNTRRWADKIMHNVEQMERYFERISMLRMEGATARSETSWQVIINRVVDQCAFVNKRAVEIVVENESAGMFVQRSELIARALFQCVRNACESVRGDGKVRIHVTENRIAGESGIVREFTVKVSDGGCGIEGDKTNLIWRPFYTTKHGHIGLGMPYVAMAAPVIGMNVDIESVPDHGTTVTLILQEQGGHL